MSQITIQCRLVASEATRRQLWELMAGKNTPLVNELLALMSQHPDLQTWRQTGKLPGGVVKALCEPLKTHPQFIGQPGRFYTSAIALVTYTYKAWLASIKRSQNQLQGKTRWLQMLKSDAELVEISQVSLDTLQTQAADLLVQYTSCSESVPTHSSQQRQTQKAKSSTSSSGLFQALFAAYDNTNDLLTQCAICYLLKQGCQVSDAEEDPKKFAIYRRKVEIQVQRLTEQLARRIPKGRDLTDANWLETLAIATSCVPADESQAKRWQDSLLRQWSHVPFPITYETSEDMTWFKNDKGRLCVKFNGLGEHIFQIDCDSRQLQWFQRFLEDQETKKNSKNQHSSALFTLRSSRIAWHERVGKGDPWNLYYLTLYCSIDTRLWTAEGTKQIQEEKAAEVAKSLSKTQEKGELTPQQQAFVKRQQSTLARLERPFPRPSKPLYPGQPQIVVVVSLGLEKPVTLAVVDAIANQVLTYRSVRQLLGKNYPLLNRQRRHQQTLSHQRHKAQKKGRWQSTR